MTKEELLKELTPLPKGYVGTIKMGEPKVLVQDNVIVLSHRDREELELYGQKIVTYFHTTNTWAKQEDGQWQMVSTQVMAIPNERKPVAVDRDKLDSYVGQYRVSPDVTYTVTRDGDKLFGQRSGRSKEELLPLCSDTFYKKGVWRGEKVFERNAEGKVVKLLDRRENNDLVWNKEGNGEHLKKSTFLVIYRPGPAWIQGKPISEQPLKEHGRYMLSMYSKGSMNMAGPFTDNTGGAWVLEAANESEAKAFVTDDPAVKTGVFLYALHAWPLVPWEKYLKK